jgi:hypothetical protein
MMSVSLMTAMRVCAGSEHADSNSNATIVSAMTRRIAYHPPLRVMDYDARTVLAGTMRRA